MSQLQESKFGEKDEPSSVQICHRFSLAEIQLATQDFDDKLVIGQGGFGKVYKGLIDNGVSTVAIKRLNSMSKQGAREFWTEIEMLSKFRHHHLVSLIGYCNDCEEMILVYEYMSCGTLHDHLHKIGKNGRSPLSWLQRLKICIGAARGLSYLHTGMLGKNRVIHRDVKSSNILLDENWIAKISDFGLSKIGPANQSFTHVSTIVKGTFGYLDPEYFFTGQLTWKSDVYAFGVVLFEVLCGKPAVDRTLYNEEPQGLAGWVLHCIKKGKLDLIIDPSLRGQILQKCLKKFAQFAGRCLHNRPKNRPTMAEVIGCLESVLELQESTYPSTKLPRMTFPRQVVLCFVGTIRANLEKVYSHGKPSRNKKSNNKSDSNNSAVPKKGGIVVGKRIRKCRSCSYSKIVTPNLKIFTFAELKGATQNFREDWVLGEGGFGPIFKGWVDEKTYAPSEVGIGMAVVIKKLMPGRILGLEEGQMEMEILRKFSHPNIVKLLGYCSEGKEFLLVFEYMPNNTLECHLFNKNAEPIPWVIRLKIAIGAARGLNFLHTAKEQVIYSGFKAANILLDWDFNAKLGGFALAKFGPVDGESFVSTRVLYTYGYAAPEFIATGHFSVKSDVFGFGVVVLEILTGMRVFDLYRLSGKDNLVDWAKPFLCNKRKLSTIMDTRLENKYPLNEAFQAAAVVLKCLQPFPKYRPSMEQVLATLDAIKEETK